MNKQSDKTHKAALPKAAKPKAAPIQQRTPPSSHLLQLAREDPASLTPAQRSQLQHTFSNRALSQLVGNQYSVNSEQSNRKSLIVQPKLTVNAVGDKYEQEADAVAREVVQKLNAPQNDAATGVPTAPPPHAQREATEEDEMAMLKHDITVMRQALDDEEMMPKRLQRQEVTKEEMQLQRLEAEEEELHLQRQEIEDEEMMAQRQETPEEDEMQLQRQEMVEDEEMHLQRQVPEEKEPMMAQRQLQDFTQGGTVDSSVETQINQTRGGGRVMDDTIRRPMEQAFGADFSNVRIHTDAQAHDLNQSIQARAFTTSNDIFFKDGEYSPGNSTGQELLAHELTHVVQQGRKKFRYAQQQYSKKEKNSSLMRQVEGVTEDISSFMVVVVGSPSPDQGVALQFVNAALQHPSNENVIWLVERSGYELRAKKENKEENYYIELIDSYAPLGGIRWVVQEQNMPEALEEFSDNSISKFFVYSHGVPGSVALRYGWSEESSMTDFGINSENIKQLNPSKFAKNASVRFDSCNTGAKNDSTTSLAQAISNQLGLPVSAWTGRTSYSDVNRGTGGVKGSEYTFDVIDSIKEFGNRWQFGDPELKTFQPQKENGTIIELPEIHIMGDPQFYTKALKVNQIYTNNPPLPGWPYDNELQQLWEQNAFDDFADRVRDIQEKELRLSGKNIDGILGPKTAHLMNNKSEGEKPNEPVIQAELTSKEERMVYVMGLLVNKYRYPKNSAAGLVGNLYAESRLIANRIEGSKADTPTRAKNAQGHMTDFTAEGVMNRKHNVRGPKKPGVGLAQWTIKKRREGLFKHKYEGAEQGANILFNLDAQVDYLITELRSKYKRVNRILEDPSSSVSDASDEILFNFERPAKVLKDVDGKKKLRSRDDPEIQGVLEDRRKLGEDALDVFQEANAD